MAFTLGLGKNAPNFHLKSTNGDFFDLEAFSNAKFLVLFFTCNHCPFVTGSDELTRQIAEAFIPEGVVFAGINSNSANTQPMDSYDEMVKRMEENKFPWVYLHDVDQSVAKAYGALRTPHFYVFNQKRVLVYTGRAVDQPRNPKECKTSELSDALFSLVKGKDVQTPITNPIGCNVKWDGKDPHWMPHEACDLV